MISAFQATLPGLSRMSGEEADRFFVAIAAGARNELVKVQWDVTYEEMGRDMLSVAEVALVNATDALLQVWLMNAAGGMWIPEVMPWEIAVVEFEPAQAIAAAKIGLLDSKWTPDDIGRRYGYRLWGHVFHEGKAEAFAFEKWGAYPGDAQ